MHSDCPTFRGVRCAASCDRCWNNLLGWQCPPNWCTFRSAKVRRFAFIRAIGRTTKFVCSLGGGGSRGSGRVSLSGLKLTWRSRGFYASGASEQELIGGSDLAGLQSLVTGEDFTAKLSD